MRIEKKVYFCKLKNVDMMITATVPHIPENYQVSEEVLSMSVKLPDGFDVEKETDKMWEEWAQ